MLNVCAHHPSGVFGPQCQPLSFFALGAGAVFPGKHLFENNVSLFTHGALKELQVFKDGRADLVEVVDAEYVADRRFNKVPCFCFRR